MNKEGRFQNVLIILLAVAVVGMSIGFAALQQQLTINGNATFEKAKWEVIWDNSTVHETEVNGTNGTVVVNNDNTNVDYEVTLKPNSSYSFTVEVVNNGTFDAKLTSINFTGKSPAEVTTDYTNRIGYTFSYGSTAATANTDTSSANPAIILAKNGGRETVTVTLTYPLPGEESQLFDEDVDLTLGVQLNFVPVVE